MTPSYPPRTPPARGKKPASRQGGAPKAKSAAASPAKKKSPSPAGAKRSGPAARRGAFSPARSPYLTMALVAALPALFWLLFSLRSGPVKEPDVPRTVPAPAPLAEEREANATIMRALVDMRGLPFEESLSAPLEDGVRQADYALLQAMQRLGLKPGDVRLEMVELRHKGAEAYHFQVVRVRSGPDARPFIAALRESLSAWADRARLQHGNGDTWTISLPGALTHELRLDPSGPEALVPPPPPSPAPPHPLPVRRPGEAARMVIVMDDLGQNLAAARSLLALPYPVTFAVWPYGAHARETAVAAHQAGREVIIHQPMEPLGYPRIKPGPNPLLTGASPEHIERTLEAGFSRVPHAVGLNNHMGSRFTSQDIAGVRTVVRTLKARRLFALDSLTHPGSRFYAEARRQGVPALRRDVFLDVSAKRADILTQLRKAEQAALLTGRAIAIGHPLPETLAALKEWAALRNRDIELVSLSALLP